jgi:hypothetical protein
LLQDRQSTRSLNFMDMILWCRSMAIIYPFRALLFLSNVSFVREVSGSGL